MKNQAFSASGQARSELREYLHSRSERRRTLPRAILVGILAGFVATGFRVALGAIDAFRDRVIEWSHRNPTFGWLAPVLFAVVGATVACTIVRRWAPETSGSGIPHLEAVLHRYRTLEWKRVLPAKFIGGLFAIGSSLAMGREGPTVQMGGATGMGVAKLLKSDTQESLTLSAAGAGAGLAAAFNAPLSGLVFVLEEVQRDFRPTVFGAAFVAAACADVVARFFGGQSSAFSIPGYTTPTLSLLPCFAVLGLVIGFLGVVFNRSLMATLNGVARLGKRGGLPLAVVAGVVAGIVAFLSPQLAGSGHELAESALSNHVLLTSIPMFLLVRFGLTMLSYGTGAPGGIFAPLLGIGAMLGLAGGHLAAAFLPGLATQPGIFAVVGMAAYFTAIVRAPLTGIVLIVEMTQSYALMLPLLAACFCAYAVAEGLGDLPIYEALLQRDLLRGGDSTALDEPMVLELEVEPGAPFAGAQVRELGLPAGVLLVSCRQGDREWVPNADTRLEAHERLTAVISPDSPGGLEAFRAGCQASV